MNERQHGTYVKYKLDGCRCYPCGFAESQYNANRERAIAYGTWKPYIDAEPVRAHLRTLSEFGIGWRRAARLAGVPTGVVSKLIYGDRRRNMAPSRRIRAQNAAALCAVQPVLENLGAAVSVDATGTHRRLHALVAAGWPQGRLAVRLGVAPSNFCAIMRRPQVSVRTVRLASALYEELWRADPRQHGVDNQAYARARNHALSHGWAPAGAWDDDEIDDPEAFPDWTGLCGTPQGRQAHRRAGIPVCGPCRTASAEERRLRKKAAAA